VGAAEVVVVAPGRVVVVGVTAVVGLESGGTVVDSLEQAATPKTAMASPAFPISTMAIRRSSRRCVVI
jgi:hypothetical protein